MAIWTKVLGPTALSSTSEVQLETKNMKLPADAKTILAIIPHCSSPAGQTAAQAVTASVILKSNDFNVTPYEVLCAPVGSTLGKSGFEPRDKAPIYPVNCPVKGGSELGIYGKGLVDHTIEPYVAVTVIIADFVVGPQFHAKIGTLTTMGAATAGETKGSGIRITNGKKITEVVGYAIGTTVATLKGIMGKFRLSSSGFKNPQGQGMGDVEFAQEPIGGAISIDATTATSIELALLTRLKDLDIPITDPVDIDDYYNLGVAVTTAGKFIVGLIYI